MRQQNVERPSNIRAETLAEARDLMLVVCRRLNEFQLRFRVEFKSHRFKRARRFAKTRSPETGWTFPSITSRCRRWASSIHASSTSASTGPSSSASSARMRPVLSSESNDRICASSSATTLDMSPPYSQRWPSPYSTAVTHGGRLTVPLAFLPCAHRLDLLLVGAVPSALRRFPSMKLG